MPKVAKQTPCSRCRAETPKRGRPPYLCAVCRVATKQERNAAAQRRYKLRHGIKLGSLKPRPCAWAPCGEDFRPNAYSALYCSKACHRAARNAAKQAWREARKHIDAKSASAVSDEELERRLNEYFERHQDPGYGDPGYGERAA